MKTIYARDYVTLPCEDASEGLRRAIEAAKRTGADEIRLEKGVYPLKTPIRYETDQTAHDAGARLEAYKEVLLLLDGLKNVTLSGEADENGEPATVLAGMNTGELHSLQPSILWAEHCERLTVKNLRFTRDPEFASAGEVERVEGDALTIRVFDGNPCYDGMGTHCMNRFSHDRKTLLDESVSYGPGLGVTFRKIGENLLSLHSAEAAKRLKVGDAVSWHQGAKTDFQCFFGRSGDLTLENLRTANANGFAMIAFDVHNLTVNRVVFRPAGNQLFTAPRDAFKLHKCSGRVEISRMYVEGVRMDGQNVHNNYVFPGERLAADELLVMSENAKSDFRPGTDVAFWQGEQPLGRAKLAEAVYVETRIEDGQARQIYRFRFEQPLAFETDGETMMLAECFQPEVYHCADSQFVNIAGAGHLLRTPHVRIERCLYRNTMNAGIQLGAEYPTFHEGGHCSDVVIRDCKFDHCGFFPRYGAVGGVGIKSSGFIGKVNRDIEITDCTFRRCGVGVDIHTAEDVRVSGCTFEDVAEPIREHEEAQ